MRAAPHRKVFLALAVALMAGTAVAPVGITPAVAAEKGSEGPAESEFTETTATLTSESPHVSSSHDAGSGGWTFVVEGNRNVASVRISVAQGDCTANGPTSWSTKVTDDELRSGSAIREVAFVEGVYCSHLLLEGTRKAAATVTTSVPNKRAAAPDPDPTESPDPDPTGSPDPDPTGSPDPDPTESPDPDPSETPDPDPYVSTEYQRCSDGTDEQDDYDQNVDHRVLAGATGPDSEASFLYQKFYPSTLVVHRGDLVEWCHNAGADWHTVSFLPADMDVAQSPETKDAATTNWWRWDETGQKAFHESVLFGPEGGDESKQCGRGRYFHLDAQAPCVLSSTEYEVSSSLWDEFFSIPRTNTFRTVVDLEPGLYRYHCKIHNSMAGYIEVVPDETLPVNPTHAEIDAEIAADYAEAQEVLQELSDPSGAYDFEKRRWEVRVGTQTSDRSVAIEQFLPSRIDVRKGDTVHFIAETDEPNTVTFPGGRQFEGMTLPTGHDIDGIKETDPQGGFSATGECDMHSCTGSGAPWGMVGLAFVWNCDADGRASGAPGSLPYVPAASLGRFVENMPSGSQAPPHGCVAGGLPEMITLPWYGDQQRAPGDLLVTEKTFHNSGTILDAALPKQNRSWSSNGVLPAGEFPSDFDARFPTEGTFKYFCAAHEFMNGVVVVKS